MIRVGGGVLGLEWRMAQEPVAFFGGMFAGLLRLEVDDDPLKEWIDRTAEKAGVRVAACFLEQRI